MGASCITFRNLVDVETLESLRVREALALAEDFYVQKIHVASDCKTVVDGVKQGSSAEYGAIIHEITERTTSFSSCNIVHEFRAWNTEAHNLAKHALSLGFGRHIWLGLPGDLIFLPVNLMTI